MGSARSGLGRRPAAVGSPSAPRPRPGLRSSLAPRPPKPRGAPQGPLGRILPRLLGCSEVRPGRPASGVGSPLRPAGGVAGGEGGARPATPGTAGGGNPAACARAGGPGSRLPRRLARLGGGARPQPQSRATPLVTPARSFLFLPLPAPPSLPSAHLPAAEPPPPPPRRHVGPRRVPPARRQRPHAAQTWGGRCLRSRRGPGPGAAPAERSSTESNADSIWLWSVSSKL